MLKRYEMCPGYDAGAVFRHIRQNMAMSARIPRVEVGAGLPRLGSISICGNGPSLRSVFPKSGKIAALNGAWRQLIAQGVLPDYIIAADPREENAEWFKNCPQGPVYLIASRCHPKVFSALANRKVQIWHLEADEEVEAGCQSPMVSAGSTIALKAARLLAYMGYDHLDLYGVDSCFALDGSDHAVAQPWDTEHERIPVQADGKMFVSCPWMIAQAQEALEQFELDNKLYTVEVHGDGLLGSLLNEHTLQLTYDLGRGPASYDFVTWLMNVESYRKESGYTRLQVQFRLGSDEGFRPNEPVSIPSAKKQEMFANVCRPALRLFGAEEGGSGRDPLEMPYVVFPMTNGFREGKKELPSFAPSMSARLWADDLLKGRDQPVVITLRELDTYWPERNSIVEDWKAFARTIKRRVIFVRDTAKAREPLDGFETCPDASLDLHKRVALYERARMNFFVSNGPSILAIYTQTTPYVCFMKSPNSYPCHRPDWVEKYMGIAYGGRYPWATLRQRFIWADDTLENIEKTRSMI